MKNKSDLSERFLDFAADVIKLLVHLKSSETARHNYYVLPRQQELTTKRHVALRVNEILFINCKSF